MKVSKNCRVYFEVVLILLLGFVSQIWFKRGHLLVGVDTLVPIDLDKFLQEYFYVWSWKTAFGVADFNKLPFLFPLGVLLRLYATLGLPFSPVVFERLLVYLLFAGSGISTYFLFRTCFPRAYSISRLLASLLYMFNFYVMFIFFALSYNLLFSYAFFPLVFALYIRWLERKRWVIYPIALALIWTILLTPSYGTPPYLVIHLFILLGYSVFWVLAGGNLGARFRKSILFGSVLLALLLLTNCFWILPLLLNLGGQISTLTFPGAEMRKLFSLNSSSVLNTFRLRGYFGFGSSYKGSPFYAWFGLYRSTFFEVLSFASPVLAFSWLLFRRRSSKAFFFTGFTLVFIALAKGVYPPFSTLNKFIFLAPPLVLVFRSVYQRFTGFISLGLAILVGYSVACIFETKYFKGVRLRFLVFLLFASLVCGVYMAPIWNGSLFSSGGLIPSMHVKIPDYYFEVAKWLDQQRGEFNVFLLPYNKLGLTMESWNGGADGHNGINIFPFFSRSRFTSGDSGTGLRSSLASLLTSGSATSGQFLSLFNVRYVLLKNDTHWEYISGNPFWIGENRNLVKSSLESIAGLEKIQSLGAIDLYRLDGSYFLPHFYVPQMRVYADAGVDVLPTILKLGGCDLRCAVYSLGGDNKDIDALSGVGLDGMSGFYVEGRQEKGIGLTSLNPAWDRGWAWPTVTVAPGGWKYFLVGVREKWRETRAREPLAKADVLVWQASKRVSEITTFGINDPQLISKVLTSWLEKSGKAIRILESVPSSAQGREYFEMVGKVLSYMKRGRRELVNVTTAPPDSLKALDAQIMEFENWITDHGKLRCRDGKYCYTLTVPEEGEYQVLVSKEGVDPLGGEGPLRFNGVEVGTVPRESSTDGWLSFGKYYLSRGNQDFVLELPRPRNLVSDNGWKRFESVSEVQGELRFSPQDVFVPALSRVGDHGDGASCTHDCRDFEETVRWQGIDEWRGGRTYELSFDYQARDGWLVVVVLEDRVGCSGAGNLRLGGAAKENLVTKKIFERSLGSSYSDYGDDEERWNHFEVELKADPHARGARLFVYSIPRGGKVADVRLRSIAVRRVPEPKLLLFKEKKTLSIRTPRIEFFRVNPAKYRIEVLGATAPYTLVFSESFSSGWELYRGDDLRDGSHNIRSMFWSLLGRLGERVVACFLRNWGYGDTVATYFDGEVREGTHRNTFLEPATFETWGKQPLDVQHLRVNGYANSWYIRPEDVGGAENYELIVEFGPQRTFYLGLLISVLALLGSTGYLIYRKVRKCL